MKRKEIIITNWQFYQFSRTIYDSTTGCSAYVRQSGRIKVEEETQPPLQTVINLIIYDFKWKKWCDGKKFLRNMRMWRHSSNRKDDLNAITTLHHVIVTPFCSLNECEHVKHFSWIHNDDMCGSVSILWRSRGCNFFFCSYIPYTYSWATSSCVRQ